MSDPITGEPDDEAIRRLLEHRARTCVVRSPDVTRADFIRRLTEEVKSGAKVKFFQPGTNYGRPEGRP